MVPEMSKRPPDINDGNHWSEMDVWDLKNHFRRGLSLKETAAFLCRAGTLDDVADKAKELGSI
jgi:hypothetical protein